MRIHLLWIATAASAAILASPATAGDRRYHHRGGVFISIGTGYYGGYGGYGGYYPSYYGPVAYYGSPYYAYPYYGVPYYGRRYYRNRYYGRRAYVRPYGYWSYYAPVRRYYRRYRYRY